MFSVLSVPPMLAAPFPLAVGASVIGLLLLFAAKSMFGSKRKFAVYKVGYLKINPMTATELTFFGRLVEALPKAVIGPQVAMSALVSVAARQNKGKYKHANRSQFSQQRLDFVVFDQPSGRVVCVIELDDHTHDNLRQKDKDGRRDAILEGVGYTVLRFDARRMPSVLEIRKCFRN